MITATNKILTGSSVDQNQYTTISMTAVANRLYLAAVSSCRNDSVDPAVPTLTGGGLTWVQIGDFLYKTSGTQRSRVTLFRALSTSPGAGAALVIDYAGVTQGGFLALVDEFAGVDMSGTNGSGAVVQTVMSTLTTAGTSLSVTLAALASTNNEAWGAFCHTANEATTVGSGFTALGDVGGSTPAQRLATEHKLNTTTVDMSWTTSTNRGAGAVEVNAAPDTLPLRVDSQAVNRSAVW